MSRHRCFTAGLALAAIIAIVPSFVPDVQAKDPIKLGVGVDPAYTPMYLAKLNNLFAKHGVDVQVIQYTQGGEAIDAIVAGQEPMGGAAEPTTLIRAARADIAVLAVFNQSPTYIKLVAQPKFTDPRQIKRIGVVPGTVSEYSTELMLSKLGIDPKSIELVNVGPPETPALLARGDIDGYFIWEPWASKGVKQGGKVLLKNGDVGYVDNLWLSADRAWFNAHKAEAKAILAALAEACKIIDTDPARAVAAVQTEAKIPADIVSELLKERQCVVRDFTEADLQSYDKIADFLAKRKITPTKLDVTKILQRGFYTAK